MRNDGLEQINLLHGRSLYVGQVVFMELWGEQSLMVLAGASDGMLLLSYIWSTVQVKIPAENCYTIN